MVRTSMIRARLLSATFVCAPLSRRGERLSRVRRCGPLPQPQSPRPMPGPLARSSVSGPELEQRYPRYVIQRQDVLKLSFPLSPEMNQTVTVSRMGTSICENAGGCMLRA